MGLQCHVEVVLEYGLSHGTLLVAPLVKLGKNLVDINIIMLLWAGMVLRYNIVTQLHTFIKRLEFSHLLWRQ